MYIVFLTIFLVSFFSSFIIRIWHIIQITYKICVNRLFRLSVKLLVNSRLFAVQFWGSQKLCTDSQLCGAGAPNPPCWSVYSGLRHPGKGENTSCRSLSSCCVSEVARRGRGEAEPLWSRGFFISQCSQNHNGNNRKL